MLGLCGSNVKGGRTTTTTNQDGHISLISSDTILIRTDAPPIRPAVAKPELASCPKFGLYGSSWSGYNNINEDETIYNHSYWHIDHNGLTSDQARCGQTDACVLTEIWSVGVESKWSVQTITRFIMIIFTLMISVHIISVLCAPPIRPAVAKPVLASCPKFGLYSSNLKGGGWTTTTTNKDDHLLLIISVHILITMGAPPTRPAVAKPVLASCPKFGL